MNTEGRGGIRSPKCRGLFSTLRQWFASSMKPMIAVISFLVRHLLAVLMAAAAGCVLWTILYLILLLVAGVFNKGLGGPLAYPAGVIMILATTVIVGWGVFAPACAVGAGVCAWFKLPRLAAIPMVTGSAFGISYLLFWVCNPLVPTHSMPSAAVVLREFVIFVSGPLGLYWWITEGPGAIFDALRRWIRFRRNKARQTEKISGADLSG